MGADDLFHIAAWQWANGTTFCAFTQAYSAALKDLVSVVKDRVPMSDRMWLNPIKAWMVKPQYEAVIREAVLKFGVPRCAVCWPGGICKRWDNVHFAAAGTKMGGLAAKMQAPPQPPPSEQRPMPPMPPRDNVVQAMVLLGVGPGSTSEDVKSAARKMALTAHPDHGGSNERMVMINTSRDLLLEVIEEKGRLP